MKLTIIVNGIISAVPLQGDATWAVLQYLLGFKRMGQDVYFVEPTRLVAIWAATPRRTFRC
jgi:hypothetical protein